MSNVDKGAIELGHGWPVGAYCCRREASPLHTIDRARHKDSSTTLSPFSPPPPNRSTRDHQLSIQKNFCPPPHSSSLSVDSIEDTFVCPNMATQLPLFSLNILKGFFILRTLGSWTRGIRNGHCEQGLTSTRYPTWPFFLLPKPDPNYFSKFPCLGFFPAGCFPVGHIKSFNNNARILLFSSGPETKSSVSKLKCLRYKKWIQGKSENFDNWFMMHLDLIFQSRQSNPRFIQVEAIKSINQKGHNLLSEAHGLKQP